MLHSLETVWKLGEPTVNECNGAKSNQMTMTHILIAMLNQMIRSAIMSDLKGITVEATVSPRQNIIHECQLS